MSQHQELPNRAAEAVGNQQIPPAPRKSKGRAVLFGLLGAVALIGMGVLGYTIAQNQANDETAATDPGAPTATENDVEEGNDSLDSEVASDSGDGAALDVDTGVGTSAEDSDDGSSTEDEAPTETSDEDDSGRTAVFRGGKLYLGGKVPSQEIADLIAGKAMSVVGPDNVVVEYEIDPTVVIDPGESTPLYVEDVVLFRFNSVAIDPPFIPLLDLGTLLLSQNPQASLTVVTRTDAVGSESVNLDVARRRADALIQYWISKGVNPDQLQADPRGEEGASEGDDEQTAALQRRAEFVITGLLD